MALRPKLGKNIDQIGDVGGGTSFADITGSPLDNTALVTYLEDVYVKKNDDNDLLSIDSNNRRFFYSNGDIAISYSLAELYYLNVPMLRWADALLNDYDNELTLHWNLRQLAKKWSINNDFEFTNSAFGIVMTDTVVPANKYRITVASGIVVATLI